MFETLSPSVTIMLGPRHRLGQWICNVVICMHLTHLNVTRIDYVSNKVILPHNVSGLGTRTRFLGLGYGTIVVTIDVNRP